MEEDSCSSVISDSYSYVDLYAVVEGRANESSSKPAVRPLLPLKNLRQSGKPSLRSQRLAPQDATSSSTTHRSRSRDLSKRIDTNNQHHHQSHAAQVIESFDSSLPIGTELTKLRHDDCAAKGEGPTRRMQRVSQQRQHYDLESPKRRHECSVEQKGGRVKVLQPAGSSHISSQSTLHDTKTKLVRSRPEKVLGQQSRRSSSNRSNSFDDSSQFARPQSKTNANTSLSKSDHSFDVSLCRSLPPHQHRPSSNNNNSSQVFHCIQRQPEISTMSKTVPAELKSEYKLREQLSSSNQHSSSNDVSRISRPTARSQVFTVSKAACHQHDSKLEKVLGEKLRQSAPNRCGSNDTRGLVVSQHHTPESEIYMARGRATLHPRSLGEVRRCRSGSNGWRGSNDSLQESGRNHELEVFTLGTSSRPALNCRPQSERIHGENPHRSSTNRRGSDDSSKRYSATQHEESQTAATAQAYQRLSCSFQKTQSKTCESCEISSFPETQADSSFATRGTGRLARSSSSIEKHGRFLAPAQPIQKVSRRGSFLLRRTRSERIVSAKKSVVRVLSRNSSLRSLMTTTTH